MQDTLNAYHWNGMPRCREEVRHVLLALTGGSMGALVYLIHREIAARRGTKTASR